MPTVKNIQDMPGYYGTSGTCKNLIAKGNNIRNIYSSEAKDDSNIYIVRMGSTPDKKSIGKTAEQRMNTNDTTGVVCIYD
ncbi:MAG: hypothetical protein LBQ24_01185 [Candidatus Peribacteria bacterium]|jgi:hypothetical protein|nr:hypothetical protein [Candidatus Peribacteria bacterium]